MYIYVCIYMYMYIYIYIYIYSQGIVGSGFSGVNKCTVKPVSDGAEYDPIVQRGGAPCTKVPGVECSKQPTVLTVDCIANTARLAICEQREHGTAGQPVETPKNSGVRGGRDSPKGRPQHKCIFSCVLGVKFVKKQGRNSQNSFHTE